MGNLVAIDMSYSKLKLFEPPMVVLWSLKILNLKDSHNLSVIRNTFNIPRLETLILWNCYSWKQMNLLGTSNSDGVTRESAVSFPVSLHRLFLDDCNLECTDSFPMSLSDQCYLQYLNLGNSQFESLPCYDHLKNLRVLDLSFCSKLKCLIRLPSTLAELYIFGCELLEKITFQSPRFTLQEFGYLGCIHLYEVEGFIKLVPVAKLDEADLGHMKWLKKYEKHEVCLVGDDELTVGRSWHIQMLYEFNIMSTSLPDIKDPNMTTEYMSNTSSLSFVVPSCPENKRLKGINVTFKYAISSEDWAWFCKISTSNQWRSLKFSSGGSKTYIPKNFYRTEGSKTYIPKNFYTKTTFTTLLNEKFGGSGAPPGPLNATPLRVMVLLISCTTLKSMANLKLVKYVYG
ncbi:putative leucine-rich repeat domain superfamily [Helianthus annuus]|nr:putative leucine-rich repeat domain superfamily [Helianthus annuus]KAJ0886597.1 putative leucine-rich repeat domain superfamily [Helianthus annuus]